MKKPVIIISLLLLTAVLVSFTFRERLINTFLTREFPSLHITSDNHPFEMERNTWHNGTLTLAGASLQYNFENVDIRIRGRGNSTWIRTEEKRPLRIRFETPQPFMSKHPHRDWVLIADHFDMSLMRNYGALYLGSLMEGMPHTPMVQHLHLYINGQYTGVYLLTDERDVNPHRTNITAHEDPALSEYYFELDGHVTGWQADRNMIGEDYFIDLIGGRAYSIRYPSGRARTPEHVAYLQSYVQQVSMAFAAHDFDRISELVDINSLVDFYIVQELFKNIDVSNFSVFMTIRGQGENRRLHFGPVWDFDRSAGNTIHWHTHEFIFAGNYNEWFKGALATPQLADIIIARWEEVSHNQITQMINRLKYLRRHHANDFRRDANLHQIQETNPAWLIDIVPEDLRAVPAWDGQADYLITWLTQRRDWLDWFFAYFYEHEWE